MGLVTKEASPQGREGQLVAMWSPFCSPSKAREQIVILYFEQGFPA